MRTWLSAAVAACLVVQASPGAPPMADVATLIRQLDTAKAMPRFHCGSVNNPIRVMMLEHDDAGVALATMRALTDDFTP